MDFINQVNPVNIGAGGLVVIIVLLILTGKLVPAKALTDLRSDTTERISEKKEELDNVWLAYKASEQAREILAGQVSELLELARTTDHFIRSLPDAVNSVRSHDAI